MDLQPDPLQPQLDPQRAVPGREPRIQRLPARPEPEPTPLRPKLTPTGAPKSAPARWSLGRTAAILLLLVSGGIMIGGSDEKPSPQPVPPAAAESTDAVPDEIVVDLKDDAT